MVKAADVDEDTHTNVMMTGFYESMLKGTAVQPKVYHIDYLCAILILKGIG